MKKGEEVDIEMEILGEPILFIMNGKGLYQYPQKPRLEWESYFYKENVMYQNDQQHDKHHHPKQTSQ